ncbi:hypothetical protein [Microbispora triticiradicis]|uniref:hypothetical protein n=1 Tax=Microbispora triticiradicis TaxID=2200763 RepID=UPI001404CE28|nr:hypothetical protein [Microbispora triticiradicis]
MAEADMEAAAIEALRATVVALQATAKVGRRLRNNPQGRVVRRGRWRGEGSRRLVQAACVLLPTGARERYREEWTNTFAELGTRRARARFVVSQLRGAVSMGWVLRRKAPGHRVVG